MGKLEVNHKELEQILDVVWKRKRPLFIWGAPGIGKSYSVREKAKRLAEENKREFIEWNKTPEDIKRKALKEPEKYFFFVDIRLSQFDPSDLKGLPSLNGDDTIEWKIPGWLKLATLKNAMGIIFFDELNLAPPSIQASAYQVILDKAIGDYSLSEDVLVLSAGNRIEDKAFVHDMAKPLQNRFLHLTLRVPTVEEWTDWAIEHGIDSRIIMFLNNNPSLLYKIDERSGEEAFPTPRTNEFWSDIIKDVDDINMLEKLTSIAVGTPVASQFVSFLKLQRTVNFKEILENPKKVKEIKDEDIDLKYAVLSIAVEYYRKKPGKERLKKVFDIANNLEPVEFSILLLRTVKGVSPRVFMQNLKTIPGMMDWVKRNLQYL